jgi:hypothetical protein
VGRTQIATNDLSRAEAEMLLSRGFALMAVQHVRQPRWMPTLEIGAEYGANAAWFAQQIGFPPGVNLWLDLEGVNTYAAHADVIDYCNAWYAKVEAAGYAPGIYVGYRPGLPGAKLYSALRFRHYWAAYNVSRVYAPEPRGFQMVQTSSSRTVGALRAGEYDVNTTWVDALGGRVLWLRPSPPMLNDVFTATRQVSDAAG